MFNRSFLRRSLRGNKVPTEAVSIIVNSYDDQRFKQFEARFLAKLDFPRVELIRIADAASMSEGYNRAAESATCHWLFFCHDDIGILGETSGAAFRDAMSASDVFGPCGTQRLVSGNWYDGGMPYNAGAVVAPDPARRGEYRLELFGRSPKSLVRRVQALDGLFIACKRQVFDAIRGFDELRLHGFHTYDIDFTFRAYLAGFDCVVTNNLLLLHDSNVSEFSEEKLAAWERERNRFAQRFERYLSADPGVRTHDNYPLADPEDGPSARRRAVRSTRWRP
ncbi:GT2 family glycosyltransferase [Paraburkholderia sp. RAU6.4a]|uniref:glycosyltransferase n=1 Tax=Paraburkholderia sp. RAU6.4a TaxID=2991067 RepID=UPI003D1E2DFC